MKVRSKAAQRVLEEDAALVTISPPAVLEPVAHRAAPARPRWDGSREVRPVSRGAPPRTSRACAPRPRRAATGREAACSTGSARGSRARTACRSSAGAARARTRPRGQKRDESGVSTSSIRIESVRPRPARPNSNLVSATMMPRDSAWAAPSAVDRAATAASSRATRSRPTSRPASSSLMLTSWPGLGLGRRGEDRLAAAGRLRAGPAGSGMPQTVPVFRYSVQPEPAR